MECSYGFFNNGPGPSDKTKKTREWDEAHPLEETGGPITLDQRLIRDQIQPIEHSYYVHFT